MFLKSIALVSFLALSAWSSAASASVVVNATGDGWCNFSNSCNNTNTQSFNNNDLQRTINDWQAFTLGNYGTITSAVLSMYESDMYGSFYGYGQGNINFYIASGLSYAGLASGPSIGTIVNGTQNSVGGYVNIALNDYGVSQLNLLQGHSLIIGGSNNGSAVDAFGWTSGQPAPYLTLQTVANNDVPEPASIALLGLGFAGMGALRRKKKA
jgi:hypothetical protein